MEFPRPISQMSLSEPQPDQMSRVFRGILKYSMVCRGKATFVSTAVVVINELVGWNILDIHLNFLFVFHQLDWSLVVLIGATMRTTGVIPESEEPSHFLNGSAVGGPLGVGGWLVGSDEGGGVYELGECHGHTVSP